MSNAKTAGRVDQPATARGNYKGPEIVKIGKARDLIKGPMLQEYWDCIGNGKTLTRPNC